MLTNCVGHFREQYAALKAECHDLVPVIGSGKIITVPIVTDDGQPIQNAIGDLQEQISLANVSGSQKKKVIKWKLLLHQIGKLVKIVLWHSCMKKLCEKFKDS